MDKKMNEVTSEGDMTQGKKKKKVLYLITKSSWGGAQRYVFDLAINIDKETYEPVIALGGTGELYDRLREAGLQVISIKGLGRDISLVKDLLASLHIIYILFTERPDVLHVNSSKVGVLGTFFGRLLFLRRVIFTCHGWAFNEDRPGWQKAIIKFLQWFTVLCSHSTIAVSNAVKKDMNWPLVRHKMPVIPLGRDVGEIKGRDDARGTIATKVQQNVTSLYDHVEDIWVGTIAELHPTKCLDVAIDAVAQLVTEFPKLRYVIIHDGQERGRLEAQVKRLSLERHVFFTGTLPDAASLLSAFDVFVLPSRSEAFGYVLIEAGQAGIPVVATEVGGIPDIVTHYETGLLIPPYSAESLRQAVSKLLSDQTLREKLAKAHQERSLTFSLQRMLKATEATYDR